MMVQMIPFNVMPAITNKKDIILYSTFVNEKTEVRTSFRFCFTGKSGQETHQADGNIRKYPFSYAIYFI